MKLPLGCIAAGLILTGCAAINQPRCKLPPGVEPFKPWPHQNEWMTGDTTLPYSTWPKSPPKHPRAVVILAQGWDSSGRDYDALGRRLAREGYAVYASENRCGRYDSHRNRRGVAPKAEDEWVDDLMDFTAMVRRKHPGVPVFYHGHSLGALVAIVVVARANPATAPRGMILHSPAFALMTVKKPVLKVLLTPFSWIRVPNLRLLNADELGPPGTTQICRWMKSEERVRKGYQIGFVEKAAALGREARRSSPNLALPVLALAGGNDQLSALSRRQQADYLAYLGTEIGGGLDAAGGRTQLMFYPDGYHILTEPPTQREALNDIVEWLDEQTP